MASASGPRFHKFTVYSGGPSRHSVEMDGKRLMGVRRVVSRTTVGDIATVTVTFITDSLNADTAALIRLMEEAEE